MAKLTGNTVVVGPDGQARTLLEGDDVPAWAADQVGDHLLDDSESGPSPYRDRKLVELKAEIDRRNADRADENKVDPQGRASIESYAAALEADDLAQQEPAGSRGSGS